MRWWLLYWIVGSGLFFVGWVFGVLMAKTTPEAPGSVAAYCWRCYVDLVSERTSAPSVATASGVTVATAATPTPRVP